MQLMPHGFSWSCSPFVIFSSRDIAPRTISFAGALWTPRVSSLRAQTPAIDPLGGMNVPFPDTGSMTWTHGQYIAAYFESYPVISLRHYFTCWALRPGGVSRMATLFAISS